jgi:predicted RND superfamily exporter protein
MFARLAQFVLRQRILVAGVLAVIFASALLGASQLTPDFSLTTFFGGNDPDREYFEHFREKWGPDDAILLVLVEPRSGTVLTRSRLERIEQVAQDLSLKRSVSAVRALTNVARVRGGDGTIDTTPVLKSLPAPSDETDPAWATWRQDLRSNDLLTPLFLSKDGSMAAMIIELSESTDNIEAIEPMVREVRDVLDQHNAELAGDLLFQPAGIPTVRAEFFHLFFRDWAVFGALSFLFINLCLFLIFRSVHGVITPFIACVVPVTMVFGIMGFVGENIGLVNQAYMSVLPAIAVADAIHLISRFHEEARKLSPGDGPMRKELRWRAIEIALERIGIACLLTSLTTGVGFLSLGVAEMPVLKNFGFFAAIGIFCAYGSVLFIIPIFLSWTTGPAPGGRRSDEWATRALLRCANFSLARPRTVLLLTGVLIAACVYWSQHVLLDNRLTSLLAPDHPITIANQHIDQTMGGLLTLHIDLRDPRPQEAAPPSIEDTEEEESLELDLDTEETLEIDLAESDDAAPRSPPKPTAAQARPMLSNPKVLQGIERVDQRLRLLKHVNWVGSPATYAATVNEMFTGERRVPDSATAIAKAYDLLAGDGEVSLLMAPDARPGAPRQGRIIIRTPDKGGNAYAELAEEARTIVEEELAGLPVEAHLSGTGHIAYRGINNITRDLRNSLILAFFVITLVIAFLFRNIRVALLCLLPNGLPLLIGYALMGFMGWTLEPSPALVFTVALGIAVDDTLHLMIRTREEIQKGLSMEEALRISVQHCGRAILITTVILAGGFGISGFSSFLQMHVMGALGATVIVAAFICDLFVLPALLMLFGDDGKWALEGTETSA